MKPICRRTLFVLAIAAMPAAALAEDAFTMQQTDIFAGPSSEFPQVASLPPNTEVGVAGCLSDWSWCDVTFANDRGWVWAGDLGYPYQNDRVAIIEYGPRLRLPVVTFSINQYWDTHYRSRPFFRERDVWVSRVHVEGSRGGQPPHGGTRVSRSGGGAQPGQPPAAQTAQPQQQAQPAQGAQPPQQGATQGQRSREEAQKAQTEERSRQEASQKAQTEQRSRQEAQKAQTDERSRQEAQRGQPGQPQASQGARPQEETAKSREGRPQPEASRAPQGEQRPQAMDQRARPDERQSQTAEKGMSQERGRESAQNAPRPESKAGEPDRGASAKGPQNEAARGQPDRGASAKGPQGERPKEEGREPTGGQQ